MVDPYVGVGTLDCLRTLRFPIRLLTGSRGNSVEAGFDAALKAFQAEGFKIEVRQHEKLHDRHFAFNERCWLVGSSLKDAGKKAFHTTEIIDARAEVLGALETKWKEGSSYPQDPILASPPQARFPFSKRLPQKTSHQKSKPFPANMPRTYRKTRVLGLLRNENR